MEKMILEHIDKEDIPAKWARLLKDVMSSTYRITIEPELASNTIPKEIIKNKKSWADMPMFGMWKDRKDLKDPASYVRQLRKPRF